MKTEPKRRARSSSAGALDVGRVRPITAFSQRKQNEGEHKAAAEVDRRQAAEEARQETADDAKRKAEDGARWQDIEPWEKSAGKVRPWTTSHIEPWVRPTGLIQAPRKQRRNNKMRKRPWELRMEEVKEAAPWMKTIDDVKEEAPWKLKGRRRLPKEEKEEEEEEQVMSLEKDDEEEERGDASVRGVGNKGVVLKPYFRPSAKVRPRGDQKSMKEDEEDEERIKDKSEDELSCWSDDEEQLTKKDVRSRTGSSGSGMVRKIPGIEEKERKKKHEAERGVEDSSSLKDEQEKGKRIARADMTQEQKKEDNIEWRFRAKMLIRKRDDEECEFRGTERGQEARSSRDTEAMRGSEKQQGEEEEERGKRGAKVDVGKRSGDQGSQRELDEWEKEKISRKLSYILRYNPGEISMRKDGFCRVEEILNHVKSYSMDQVMETVSWSKNAQGESRFQIREEGHGVWIRAMKGPLRSEAEVVERQGRRGRSKADERTREDEENQRRRDQKRGGKEDHSRESAQKKGRDRREERQGEERERTDRRGEKDGRGLGMKGTHHEKEKDRQRSKGPKETQEEKREGSRRK